MAVDHHRGVHDGGWTINGDPRDRLTFTGPTANASTAAHPAHLSRALRRVRVSAV